MRPPKLTEKEFMAQVVQLARRCGWVDHHPYDSRRSRAGWPDLTLLHEGRGEAVFAELKVRPNRPTPDQKACLARLRACGLRAYLWFPEDWPDIEKTLIGR